jgi:3-deoxy-D-manno-octulosonate 8-phosphate phosphatase (KDO 8-P phosphatase)
VLDRDVARRIKAVGLDVDGVLTDGGVYIGLVAHTPIEFKRFNIQDGLGVKLLRAAGLPVILVSGRPSEASEARAAELQVDELLQVAPDAKLAALEQALERRGIALDACAFVGDDLADVPVLRAVGLPIAVANATPEVKAVAKFVTSVPGGHGAVRQVAELLLQARGDWSTLVERYLEAGDVARPAERSR